MDEESARADFDSQSGYRQETRKTVAAGKKKVPRIAVDTRLVGAEPMRFKRTPYTGQRGLAFLRETENIRQKTKRVE
jgi:hypothetical protein